MQAVEAKEAVEIQNETITLASISYQNFFRNYKKKSGMTGTAATETAEFSNIYELTVSVVPPNRPNVRKDNSDVVFRSTEGACLSFYPHNLPDAPKPGCSEGFRRVLSSQAQPAPCSVLQLDTMCSCT